MSFGRNVEVCVTIIDDVKSDCRCLVSGKVHTESVAHICQLLATRKVYKASATQLH